MSQGYREFSRETERLVIRAWTLEDASDAFEMYGDPRVVEYLTGTTEESVETQRDVLRRIIHSYSNLHIVLGSFPIVDKSTGSLVGAVLLKPLPRNEDLDAWRAFRDDPSTVPPIHEIEVGWHLKHAHWGKGYATEAAREMLRYAFEDAGLKEVYAIVYPQNTASIAVTRRLNMRPLGPTDRFYGVQAELFVTP